MGQVFSVVDFTDLLARVGEDRQFMDELLVLFSEELPALMRTMEKAVLEADLMEVERTAHAVAGMLANLSASQAQSSATSLEQLGRNRQSKGLGRALGTLRQDLEEVCASIRLHLEESPT